MRLSKREVILIIILVIIALGGGYYFLIYTPLSKQQAELTASIERKNNELADAMMRTITYGAMTAEKERLTTQWGKAIDELPDRFDDADFLTRVQKIIIPHTRDIYVRFSPGGKALTATTLHSVNIDFTAPRGLISLYDILKKFEKEDIYNRINNISYNLTNKDGDGELKVTMTVDLLTD